MQAASWKNGKKRKSCIFSRKLGGKQINFIKHIFALNDLPLSFSLKMFSIDCSQCPIRNTGMQRDFTKLEYQ